MFRKRNEPGPSPAAGRRRGEAARERAPAASPAPVERITSVLGKDVTWKGQLGGSGGVRIEGTFEGEIALRGVLVVGETGRVTCDHLCAHMVIVAGIVRGDITATKLEIRSTGRVWGNVATTAFATEEGAFLRGQIRMEEQLDLGIGPLPVEPLAEAAGSDSPRENADEPGAGIG